MGYRAQPQAAALSIYFPYKGFKYEGFKYGADVYISFAEVAFNNSKNKVEYKHKDVNIIHSITFLKAGFVGAASLLQLLSLV